MQAVHGDVEVDDVGGELDVEVFVLGQVTEVDIDINVSDLVEVEVIVAVDVPETLNDELVEVVVEVEKDTEVNEVQEVLLDVLLGHVPQQFIHSKVAVAPSSVAYDPSREVDIEVELEVNDIYEYELEV